MVRLNESRSLDDFVRDSQSHLERLAQSGEPEVLTVDGEPRLIVQDARAYQKLLDALDEAEAVEIIRQRLESADRGNARPMRDALRELAREEGIELEDRR